MMISKKSNVNNRIKRNPNFETASTSYLKKKIAPAGKALGDEKAEHIRNM